MTSKNSFYLSSRENLKRRGVVLLIFVLYFFFAYPVAAALVINNTAFNEFYDKAYAVAKARNTLYALAGVNGACMFFFSLLAALSAIQGFSYLHRRDKVDLYHALPVSSNRRFWVIYLNGILPFAVIYLLALLSFTAVCFLMGLAPDSSMIRHMMMGYGLNLLYYLCIYNTCALAAILTGNTVLAFFAAPILLFYEFICKLIAYCLFSGFFITYYARFKDWQGLFSPVINFSYSLGTMADSSYPAGSGMLPILVRLLLYSIIILAVSWLLYRLRPAESSSKALAFPRIRPVLKCVLLIPFVLSFMLGFLLLSQGTGLAPIWLIIGLLFGHGLLEILLDFDLHSIFHHKLQLLLCSAACFLIYFYFAFDPFGYDRYVPDAAALESAAWIPSGDPSLDTVVYDGTSIRNYDNYPLDEMRITDTGLITGLAESAVNDRAEFNAGASAQTQLYYIKYRLKSGREIYRRMRLDVVKHKDLLEQLYASPEFKKGRLQLYNEKFLEDLKQFQLTIFYQDTDTHNGITGFDFDAFCQAYRLDFETLTYSQSLNEYPCGVICLSAETAPKPDASAGNSGTRIMSNTAGYNYGYSYNEYIFPVYDSYANTLSWLEDNGLEPSAVPDVSSVQSIIVDGYLPNEMQEDSVDYVSITITDPQQLKEIVPNMVPDYEDSIRYSLELYDTPAYYNLKLTVQYMQDGISKTTSCLFSSLDVIPEFIKAARQ